MRRFTCWLVAAVLCSTPVLAANNPNLYVAMGCGITKGSPPTEGDPWPERLEDYLGKTVINAAKSGSRVGYGSSKVDSILDGYKPGFLLILYGTNDIGVGNPIDYIIGELRYMIRAAKARLTIPVIGTLPPAFNGNGGNIGPLNVQIRLLAASEGIQCADVGKAFNNNSSLIMYDGLHPTPAGQQLIAKTFRNAIWASKPVAPPAPTISPASRIHGNGAESGSIAVSADSSVAWSATTTNTWIAIASGASGTGNGTVQYTLQQNDLPIYRAGRIQISNKVFLVRQAGCMPNLALITNGTSITGNSGNMWTSTIDGVISGYTGSTGYGRVSTPTGSMILDLKTCSTLEGIGLLLWDLDTRTHRYTIDASQDGSNWTPIVDRSTGNWQSWQDIELPAVRARYLRLNGLYCSVNTTFAVVEWEVYGTPGIRLASSSASLPRTAGSGTISVLAPTDQVWSASTAYGWIGLPSAGPHTGTVELTYTVTANANESSRSGTILIDDQPFVVEQDGTYCNLALASRGSTITGNNGGLWDVTIDGISQGYTDYLGYGCTWWRDDPNAPGFMLLDLHALCKVDRIRLLLWDRDSRYYQYRIEGSGDGLDWQVLVDRTTGQQRSWQDIALGTPVFVRYLRLTGTYNSVNKGFHVVEWEVYGSSGLGFVPSHAHHSQPAGSGTISVSAPDDQVWTASTTDNWINLPVDGPYTGNAVLVYSYSANRNTASRSGIISIDDQTFVVEQEGTYCNLALASRGSTITGNNGGLWDVTIDGISQGYTDYEGFGYTFWRDDPNAPGNMTLDLQERCEVDHIRLLLWDGNSRYYQYYIEGSEDGTNWTILVDRTTGQNKSWQDIVLSAPVYVRYLRLIGTYNSQNRAFHVVEWEVYGGPSPLAPSTVTINGRGNSGVLTGNCTTQPIILIGSAGEPPWTNLWDMVDQDLETLWAGQSGDRGWWVAMGYDSPGAIRDIEVDLDESSLTNIMFLYSPDARSWTDMRSIPQEEDINAQFLWLIFPDDESGLTPRVREIRVLPPPE